LTRHFAKHSISPESSDGFASVGTILPNEEAALLPGGLFTSPTRMEKINGSCLGTALPCLKLWFPLMVGRRALTKKMLIMLGLADVGKRG
jgi:hypothetical protein